MLLIGCGLMSSICLSCRIERGEESMNADIRKQFGEAVRKIRMSQGESQESFAELAGLHRTYIGGVERGERNISLINIKKIADALRISLEELFRRL